MARSAITTLAVGRNSAEPAITALTAQGGSFVPGGVDILRLSNTGGAAVVVTIPTNMRDALGIPVVRTFSLAAGAVSYVRVESTPFIQSDGTVHVDVDTASVVKALVLLPGLVDVGSAPVV
jgi:non-ribosomal peptide synthetase component E (peptide arylation enzyme)